MGGLSIVGGVPLQGRVRVGGRKNSAVALIPAALLAAGPSTIDNVPRISDVDSYIEIITSMGVTVDRPTPHSLRIDPTGLINSVPSTEVVRRLRASYYLWGVLLARFGEAEVGMPGGCDIGQRPIDQHLKGFRALGAEAVIEHGVVKLKARRLVGAPIYLDVVSVGATINIMLAACLAEGTTVIENAAKEPHVVDLANFLNAMGARVVGAGTDVVKIKGIGSGSGGRIRSTGALRGADHAIIPDEIEAATFMVAAVATRGDVVVENVITKHLDPITAKLRETGADIEENGDWVRVRMAGRPKAVNVKTAAYPGFPTDAQQPMTALLSTAEGTSMVTDTIWEARFKHVGELLRMGADIKVEGRTAIINGVERLSGAEVEATDLRAGAALLVAGLMAEGETVVKGIELVERGYEGIEQKFRQLGAQLERLPDEGDEGSAPAQLRVLKSGS
ncbi:MAG TPA: UDP-N-acetylglucosamine 1-carboxyvinyltransferase [Sphingobacteriaceae bacterium]|nr:UDP-N-acetylglucosamine 1-carboxyvinyltransferase [Sphingobacteriaceae bacterium]